jgi:signal transduction histidine kinase
VIWNLLTNAVKFSPDGSRIVVSLGRVGGADHLEVVDEGTGIDGAFLPYVFDPFRQGDASTTREHGGLGLGLSIVQRFTQCTAARRSRGVRGAGTYNVLDHAACCVP